MATHYQGLVRWEWLRFETRVDHLREMRMLRLLERFCVQIECLDVVELLLLLLFLLLLLLLLDAEWFLLVGFLEGGRLG